MSCQQFLSAPLARPPARPTLGSVEASRNCDIKLSAPYIRSDRIGSDRRVADQVAGLAWLHERARLSSLQQQQQQQVR